MMTMINLEETAKRSRKKQSKSPMKILIEKDYYIANNVLTYYYLFE